MHLNRTLRSSLEAEAIRSKMRRSIPSGTTTAFFVLGGPSGDWTVRFCIDGVSYEADLKAFCEASGVDAEAVKADMRNDELIYYFGEPQECWYNYCCEHDVELRAELDLEYAQYRQENNDAARN